MMNILSVRNVALYTSSTKVAITLDVLLSYSNFCPQLAADFNLHRKMLLDHDNARIQ
jgi:hypothetical protein